MRKLLLFVALSVVSTAALAEPKGAFAGLGQVVVAAVNVAKAVVTAVSTPAVQSEFSSIEEEMSAFAAIHESIRKRKTAGDLSLPKETR